MLETPEERIAQFSDVSLDEIKGILQESTILKTSQMYDKATGREVVMYFYREGTHWVNYAGELGKGLGKIGFEFYEDRLAEMVYWMLQGCDWCEPHNEIKPKLCALINVEFGNPSNPKTASIWVVRKAFRMWDDDDYDNPAFEYNYRYRFDIRQQKWVRYSIKAEDHE